MFEPGQFVQCVDDGAREGVKLLTRGRIYTVALSSGSLMLIEEHDPPTPFIAFRASRFRPIPDAQLRLVRQMLEPTRSPERVPERSR